MLCVPSFAVTWRVAVVHGDREWWLTSQWNDSLCSGVKLNKKKEGNKQLPADECPAAPHIATWLASGCARRLQCVVFMCTCAYSRPPPPNPLLIYYTSHGWPSYESGASGFGFIIRWRWSSSLLFLFRCHPLTSVAPPAPPFQGCQRRRTWCVTLAWWGRMRGATKADVIVRLEFII